MSRSEHDQQQQQHPPLPSFPRSSSRRPHTANRTQLNPHISQTRSERDRSQHVIHVSPNSTTPPLSPPPRPISAQLAREKEIREKEEREKEEREREEREKEEREKEKAEKELREKEEKEEAQRLAQLALAEQFARRSDERQKNLPFYVALRPSEETNLSGANALLSQTQTSNSQLSPSPQQTQTQLNQHSSQDQAAQLNAPNTAQSHAQQQRPSDAELRQLDSSLKKCTGFIRKIRAMGVNEESLNSLCTEAHSLNLSRYISEVVAALAESKLRSGDSQYFVTLVGQLHRRYEEFLPELLTTLSSVVTAATPPARDLPSRKGAMRILVETFIVAMYADVNLITNILRQLMRTNSRDSKDDNLNSLSIISSFVRAAIGVLIPHSTTPSTSGTIPRAEKSTTDSISQVAAEEQTSATEMSEKHFEGNDLSKTSWEDDVVSTATKLSIQSALQMYFESEVSRMVKEASENLQKAGEAVARAKQVRDNPDDVTAAAFENAKQYCDKVISSANILAEALNKATYSSPSDTPSSYEGSVVMDPTQVFVANPFSYVSKNRNATQDLDVMQSADHPFESDEQRMFYTELIEVESLASTFKNTEKGGDKKAEGGDRTASSQREGKRKVAERTANMERLLNKLPGIESKDAADSFVQQFVLAKESSKIGTKRLSKMLFTVSPQKLNVLPAYARIAASLQPLYGGEIGTTVSNCLQEDFRFYAGKAEVDEKTLSLCIKCSHYIGEFVKFDIISITTMFDLLSLCMKDLSCHRIDAVCHLLESCGRFVYRTFSSHIRMSSILETLWRVKSVRNLEARHNTLIENAFYAVRLSSGGKAQRVKARPPIHEYIRHLIYHRLDSANVTWTRNQLLKLPWDDELEFYVTKKFVKISRARYSTIPHVAALIFALHKHKLSLVISIVDLLLECIRSGMEKNDGRESQRRLAEVYLFGELYKCGVVSEGLLYNVLYQIITLGHDEARSASPTRRQPNSPDFDPMLEDTGQSGRSLNGTVSGCTVPDPPGDFFRVRLVCVMLESCGRALVRSNRRAFEIFLAFLERYLFCKTYQAGLGDRVPLHIEYMLDDVLDGIIISNRRVVKDTRHSYRGENVYMNSSGAVEMSWQAALTRPFHRNRTLEEAVTAIYRIEQSHTDAALINMPVRHVAANNFPASPINGALVNTFNGISHSQRSHVHSFDDKKTRYITRRAENGNRDTLEDEEIEDVSSDGAMYGDDEPLIADADGLLSGDDAEVAADNIFNGRDPHSNYKVDPGYNDEFEADAHFDPADEDDDNYDEDDEDEDEDDDDDDDEVEDDIDIILQSEDKARMEEEEAFAKELAAFTAEEVQNARASSARVARLDRMVIPMSLMSKRLEEERAAEAALAVNGSCDSDEWSYDDHDDDEGGGGDTGRDRRRKRVKEDPDAVEFKVLMRKGGKSQLTGLKVPATSSIAVAAKESETADIARHEETKRLVLGSSVVQNEEYDDFDDEIPMQVEIHAREKEESIRQQRITDEHELLATLYRNRPRR